MTQHGGSAAGVATSHDRDLLRRGPRPHGNGEREEATMGHEAEHDRVPGESHRLHGEPDQRGYGSSDRPFRWACGITPPACGDVVPGVPEAVVGEPGEQPARVPRPRSGELADCIDTETDVDTEPDARPPMGCRTDRRGWAGAHRHGAVRPSPRTNRQERPPGRWC